MSYAHTHTYTQKNPPNSFIIIIIKEIKFKNAMLEKKSEHAWPNGFPSVGSRSVVIHRARTRKRERDTYILGGCVVLWGYDVSVSPGGARCLCNPVQRTLGWPRGVSCVVDGSLVTRGCEICSLLTRHVYRRKTAQGLWFVFPLV